MAIQATDKIWHNGKLIPWNDAQIHVMSHVINYGSSVFEGIRCYAPSSSPAIFRLRDHMQRLMDSAKIYRIEFEYTLDHLCASALELVAAIGVWPCYLRPIVMRGYGEAGVNPFNSPIEVYMTNYPWGKYLGHGNVCEGVDACDLSWLRLPPTTNPAKAHYPSSYLTTLHPISQTLVHVSHHAI